MIMILDKLDALQAKLQSSVNFSRFEYYRKIFKNYLIHPLVLNTLLKALLKKILCIQPLFHNNKFIADFKEKSEILNFYFARQCSLIDNGSILSSLFRLITHKSLSNVDFPIEDIKNIIRKLDSNKAYGGDMSTLKYFWEHRRKGKTQDQMNYALLHLLLSFESFNF